MRYGCPKDCPDRCPEPNCHMTCEIYKEFQKRMEVIKQNKFEAKALESYSIQSYERMRRYGLRGKLKTQKR